MDPERRNSAINATSGIPRASKLPVLNSKQTQSFLPTPTQDVASPVPKAPVQKPGIRKRSSLASLPQPNNQARSNGAPARSATSRTAGSAPRSLSSSTSSTRTSVGRQASSSTTHQKNAENQDRLGSLDGFRSASRQGFQDSGSPLEDDPEHENLAHPKDRRPSRPSLSDRTIDSLQNLPSTPKVSRKSSFFSSVESPMGPPPRPGSRTSRSGSTSNSRASSRPSSRPGTSDGNPARPLGRPSPPPTKAPASAKPGSRTSIGSLGPALGDRKGRSISSNFSSKLHSTKKDPSPSPRVPSLPKVTGSLTASNTSRVSTGRSAAKTVAVRLSKSRSNISDAFGPTSKTSKEETSQTVSSSHDGPKTADRATSNPTKSSSAALREQIAAAKAAARKEKARLDSPQNRVAEGAAFDFDLHKDPFNQAPKDDKHILKNRINNARADGRLNIAALGLTAFPDEVLNMYSSEAISESNLNWAEIMDLARLNAADNAIEELDDVIFPDKSLEEFEADEQNHTFGGLEQLDLHGNSLSTIPIGLRRLERLTSLNLAHNKIEASSLEIISQITCLKDLRLGYNAISGNLATSICQLTCLEVLELQSNRLLGLPEALRELVNLKVLNVSGNQITTLPMEALQELQLTELDASGNALIGSLFPVDGRSAHATLQTVKIANNSLAALSFSEPLDLPRLRLLDVTNNHLTGLPNISGWTDLITLTASDNKIAEFPTGFTSLQRLRNVNFTNNDLRLVDREIANMESLESLILASNPLREKKFLNMSTYDMKNDLRARLESPAKEVDHLSVQTTQEGVTDPQPQAISSPTSTWVMKSNCTLDLAGRSLSDDINDSLGSFLRSHEVRDLQIQSNKLTAVPPALWLGQNLTSLNLSNNSLGSDYLSDELELPLLRDLHLNRCSLTTLEPLLTQLRADKLQTINITANRLTGPLPILRDTYPALITLFAADNKFVSVNAASLRGLQAVSLASNDIQQLPAEIGLLWDEGLKSFEVGSNAFRMPNHRILEKGTEATFRWLRDKLPAPAAPPNV